jgi:hypothetical protein
MAGSTSVPGAFDVTIEVLPGSTRRHAGIVKVKRYAFDLL